jgi:hypothetical protein
MKNVHDQKIRERRASQRDMAEEKKKWVTINIIFYIDQ